MPERNHFDDATIDRILSGRPVTGEENLVAFVQDVQIAAATTPPTPNSALLTMFAHGLSTEKGDLPATAASNVTGPDRQAAGLPKRKKNMLDIALAKLGAMGLAAKIGVAAGALAMTGTAAAATGNLPEPAQERAAEVAALAGIDIPGGKSAGHRQDAEHRQDQGGPQDAEHRQDGTKEQAEVKAKDEDAGATASTPPPSQFGTTVSGGATSGAPQEDGKAFGESTSSTARATFQPTDTPTAQENPGTDARNDEGTQAPQETPTAEDNPSSGATGGAGPQQPSDRPAPDENPGSGRRP
ncbi:MAG: hypothetical protein M3P34_00325 [Actinomycetota bacterium]|nr:hypothetical protein [Actinomycetota bacterium]